MNDLIRRQYAIDDLWKDGRHEVWHMRIAKQIVHNAIDNTPMAEDIFVGIKEKLHKAVEKA